MDYGDHAAAEDAWTLVAHQSRDNFYLVYAHDALAHLAALRGDKTVFEEHAARCDAPDWESGSSSVKAEILYYRGLSHGRPGRLGEAGDWLRRAVAFTEEHRYNRQLFRAEEALKALSAPKPSDQEPTPAAPTKLRDGLRTMRRELVGVGN